MSHSVLTPDSIQVLSSRPVYDNPWIQVIEHQVIHPGGAPGIYGIVKFKNRAVGVVPYEEDHVWMVGQHRFAIGAYSWEIPEGGSPFHEELAETARRELREETGLQATSMERILELHLSNSVSDEYGVVFLARGLTRGPSLPEETEQLQVRRMRLDDVYAEISAGRITDSLTVAGILKLLLMRQEGLLT